MLPSMTENAGKGGEYRARAPGARRPARRARARRTQRAAHLPRARHAVRRATRSRHSRQNPGSSPAGQRPRCVSRNAQPSARATTARGPPRAQRVPRGPTSARQKGAGPCRRPCSRERALWPRVAPGKPRARTRSSRAHRRDAALQRAHARAARDAPGPVEEAGQALQTGPHHVPVTGSPERGENRVPTDFRYQSALFNAQTGAERGGPLACLPWSMRCAASTCQVDAQPARPRRPPACTLPLKATTKSARASSWRLHISPARRTCSACVPQWPGRQPGAMRTSPPLALQIGRCA